MTDERPCWNCGRDTANTLRSGLPMCSNQCALQFRGWLFGGPKDRQ